MRTFFSVALAFALSCLVPAVYGLAQEPADTVDVVATGYGKDVNAATQNACRAAVEQVVGSMVYAESLVESGEMISDKILSFSAGYIESHKTQGEPKLTDDGLYSVRIVATVKRRKLGEELQKTGVNRVFFDGASLHMKTNMQADSQDTAIDLMKQMVDNLHINAMSTTLISKDYDINTNRAIFEIETKLDTQKYETFRSALVELLPVMAGQTVITNQTAALRKPGEDTVVELLCPKTILDPLGKDTYHFLIFNSWPNTLRAGQESRASVSLYTVPRVVFNQVIFFFNRRILVIEALGDNDEVLNVTKTPWPMPYFTFYADYILRSLAYNDWEVRDNSRPANTIVLFPALRLQQIENIRDITRLHPGLPVHREKVSFNFPQEELGKIKSVRFSYE